MPDQKKPAPDEPKTADERPRVGAARGDESVAKPSEEKAAVAEGPSPLRMPDEWAAATGRTRRARIVAFVNNVAQKDREFSGEHTAAARLHGWGRSDVIERPITREAYELAILATKRAPKGERVPVPHPDALFVSIHPQAAETAAKG